MGTCNETRADKTKFIINEDYKMKQKMVMVYRNYEKKRIKRNNQFDQKINDSEFQSRNEFPTCMRKGNCEKIISKNNLKVTDVYKIEDELGEGGYGKVFLVRHKKMNQLRAMKIISVNSKNKDEKTDEEIELLKKLDHPNIVKLFEYFSDEDKYYLITEYCKGGALSEIIKNHKFSENGAAYIMYQIFRTLIYCHNTHHLIHRDIKPENIVIYQQNKTDEDLYDIKLIDFGISKIFNPLDKNIEDKIEGSFYYMAPEIYQKKGKYDEKIDIWSCGIILYMLVIGKYPFGEKSEEEIIKNIITGNYPLPEGFVNLASEGIIDLINQCLKVDPSERISAKKALDHKFFKEYNTKDNLFQVSEPFLHKTINNIKKYNIKNPLQELTFTYLVHNYQNQDEIALINRVFTNFNTNNDGKLTREELKEGIIKHLFKGKKNKSFAEKEVNLIFKKLDWDNSGHIECEEFIRAGIDKKLLKDRKVLRFTFDFLDKNGNEEISFEELKEVFGIGNGEDEKALIRILKSIDTDFNGQISFEEYYNMIVKIIEGLI